MKFKLLKTCYHMHNEFLENFFNTVLSLNNLYRYAQRTRPI